jgi:transposase
LFYIAGATSEIIKGTHIHVSHKHLQKYLGEFEFRYNMRNNPGDMFEKLIKAF